MYLSWGSHVFCECLITTYPFSKSTNIFSILSKSKSSEILLIKLSARHVLDSSWIYEIAFCKVDRINGKFLSIGVTRPVLMQVIDLFVVVEVDVLCMLLVLFEGLWICWFFIVICVAIFVFFIILMRFSLVYYNCFLIFRLWTCHKFSIKMIKNL